MAEQQTKHASGGREVATLGGGCFWCLEAVFEQLRGVDKVESGYAGGAVAEPTYHQVCTGDTGHAEVVQIKVDPAVITYREVLDVFFASHDPTTLNRQGPDHGTQYRSAIFYHTTEQEQTARDVISKLNAERIWNAAIVTEVVPLQTFYRAEDYHQGYYRDNPNQGYFFLLGRPRPSAYTKRVPAPGL